MLDSLPRPFVIAHRGASAHAPENTISAFQLAIDQGADAIELDVQLTADKKVVVFHDFYLDRITNGTGALRAYSLKEIQQLNASYAFGLAFSEEKIPTLEEVFQIFGKNIFYNIELKYSGFPFDSLPAATAEVINKYKLHDQVLISSFNPYALVRIEKSLPDLAKGLLLSSLTIVDLLPLFAPFLRRIISIHIPYTPVSIRKVDSIHQLQKLALCYTINHPEEIHSFLKSGFDGFFTDDPALARRTLASGNA